MEKYHTSQGVWEAFGTSGGPQFPAAQKHVLQQTHSEMAIEDMIDALHKKHIKMMFEGEEDYPQQLSAIIDPPYAIYYAGNISALQNTMIGIVGTRRASRYGLEMASAIAEGLAEKGICIVSGLAHGIDAAAHNATLKTGGITIGVLGTGIDNPYPSDHKTLMHDIAAGNGLILSEFPIGAPPLKHHFPYRNRIISGLSEGIVFV